MSPIVFNFKQLHVVLKPKTSKSIIQSFTKKKSQSLTKSILKAPRALVYRILKFHSKLLN